MQRSWEWRWEVPGYVIGRLLGYGPLGEVWLATRAGSLEPVVLRRMAGFAPADVAVALAVLPELPTEHLVRLLDVREVDEEAVLVMEHAAGGSLAALVQRCGSLSAGQVVTALAPVAFALASAHAHGLSHSRLTASEVLLTADGRPLLDGLGWSALGLEGTGDLQALVQLAGELMGDALPAGEWIDAAAFGRALLAVCPAEPLLSSVRTAPVAPARPVRRLLVVAVLVLASSVAVAARLLSAPDPVMSSWSTVLAGLDASRATAFARGDPGVLAEVYAAGSPDLAADTERLRRLTARHERVEGLTHRVVSVRVITEGPEQVTLDVVQSLDAYLLRGPGPPQQVGPGPEQRQAFALVRTRSGWRITDVRT
ncbi:MAG: Serine/threonine protein kinase [Frankiales bacterium]|nr:Serine/threonine protein kinase [Frankiales bacterium]